MLREGGDDNQTVPSQYSRIVQSVMDLKNDIEFGYQYNRDQASTLEQIGSRAYQRAVNKIRAEQYAEMRKKQLESGGH